MRLNSKAIESKKDRAEWEASESYRLQKQLIEQLSLKEKEHLKVFRKNCEDNGYFLPFSESVKMFLGWSSWPGVGPAGAAKKSLELVEERDKVFKKTFGNTHDAFDMTMTPQVEKAIENAITVGTDKTGNTFLLIDYSKLVDNDPETVAG